MVTNKKLTSIRLSAEARELRAALSAKLGVDQTAVIELAIRQMAQREGVTVKATPPARTRKAKAAQ